MKKDFIDWLKIYSLPAVAVILGLLIAFGMYWQLRTLDQQRIEKQFTELAQQQSQHLQWNLLNFINALHTAGDLFATIEDVGKSEFRELAHIVGNRYPGILALEWLPRIANENRDHFVEKLNREHEEFLITEFFEGRLRPAQERDRYYPVTYIEPYRDADYNRWALGFDHFSEGVRREPLEQALRRGSVTVTPSLVFERTGPGERQIQDMENNLGIILYKPVYETLSAPAEDESADGDMARGVISLLFKIQSAMRPVFIESDLLLEVAVFEHPVGVHQPERRPIYASRSVENLPSFEEISAKINFQEQFPVADRVWSLVVWPTEEYINTRQSWAPFLALLLGLLLTGIFTRGAYWLSNEFLGRRKQFHSVINSAEDAIVCIDSWGEILLWNTAAEKIFDYNKQDIMEKNIKEIFDEKSGSFLEQELDKFRREGESEFHGETVELDAVDRIGEKFPVEITLSDWQQQNNLYHTVIIRDITERVRRKEELEKLNRELEEKVKHRTEELEQFVYAASHDLKEPARVIQTYAEFLSEDMNENLEGKAREDLNFIRNSAAQMNELIEALRKLSRVGRDEIDPHRISLEDCVEKAIKQQRGFISDNEIKIIYEDLPEVYADPALMTDLYHNLLNNALKHGGEKLSEVKFIAEQKEDRWLLGVKDDGQGIGEEFHNIIFEPFKHLNPADEQEGTGIGLSICKRIVERHGGEMWLESEPGKGACFFFTIPVNKNEKRS